MENLDGIFKQLRELLLDYRPPFISKSDDKRHFDLWSIKDLVIEERKRKEVYYAGAIIQSSYVGFYYMPVYAEPEVKNLFKSELLSRLKGKSCFHIHRLDPILLEQIKEALERGFVEYQQRGWV
ncbi:MAG: hypothetical protein C0410_08630 [Anaerolinea sp.]|nr:hypothetical protein [Anaerolinea sp.]